MRLRKAAICCADTRLFLYLCLKFVVIGCVARHNGTVVCAGHILGVACVRGLLMASTKTYLEFVLGQLSALKDISSRSMMGEYVLYYQGKVVGGIYDDRLLLKPTKTALQILSDLEKKPLMDIPYEGAKEMLVVDIDDCELSCRLVQAVADDLPISKNKKKKN